MDQKDWSKILEIIKGQVSPAEYKTWFSKSRMLENTDDLLLIGVPSAFIKQQLSTRYLETLKSAIQTQSNKELSIDFKVDSNLTDSESSSNPEGSTEDEDLELTFYPSNFQRDNGGLSPKFTLEKFVVGLTNNLAYAAAQAVVQNPGISYNPLFIYGGTGVGKTHLMHAIGNAILKKTPHLKVIYCSSEKFTNDFVQSLQTKKMGEFRSKYRNVDLLLIDDIQFIAGRDSTQEEFFHSFNELQGKNSQVILTSDRPPDELQKLESRLISRFQGGLMVDIQLPDFDTRVAILKAKCAERGENVPEECLTVIAESVQSNARELEGKLIQIIQSAKMLGQSLDLTNIRSLLGKPNPTLNLQKIDHKKVFYSVNQYFKIKMSELTGPRRKKELVLPRQLAMYILYEDCKLSYERIGQLLGGRDHTTILHGVDKIRQSQLRDREIQRLLIEIKQQLAS